MLLKITLFCVFGVKQCLRGSRFKKHIIFPHTCTLYVAPQCSAFLETRWFLQSSSFWEARCALIGQLFSALWLAEYLKLWRKCYTLTILWCRVPARRHKNKKKNIINEAFVAFSEDIITDSNDSYGLFKQHHVCICDRRNAKQALLYTAQNSHLNSQ